MENVTFYIIFHKKIYTENTPNLPCFHYLGANELIKKEVNINLLKHPVIYEYDISSYNSAYQMLQFRENSIILNFPPPPTPFVGICQYDMSINEEKFKLIFQHLNGHKTMVGFFTYSNNAITDILNKDQWNELLYIYNMDNNTNHNFDTLSEYPFFLMNTYILPSWFYSKLQKQLYKFLPTILKFLNYNMKHIAGTLEATNSLIIACALKEELLDGMMSDAITHIQSQKLAGAE